MSKLGRTLPFSDSVTRDAPARRVLARNPTPPGSPSPAAERSLPGAGRSRAPVAQAFQVADATQGEAEDLRLVSEVGGSLLQLGHPRRTILEIFDISKPLLEGVLFRRSICKCWTTVFVALPSPLRFSWATMFCNTLIKSCSDKKTTFSNSHAMRIVISCGPHVIHQAEPNINTEVAPTLAGPRLLFRSRGRG